MEKTQAASQGFKLNYKRTFTIGFAFFGILLLWEVYDKICPVLLSELFKDSFGVTDETKVQYLVGIMMALDNIAALILLPIFGRLSDKTHTRLGKRMPYILVGTFVCSVAFPFIPVFYHYSKAGGVIAMMAIVVLFAMMYRNPAVALMPDMTPKPLRSKANGIINIMGYIGGGFYTLIGFVFILSDYLGTTIDKETGLPKAHTWAYNNIWAIEGPFLIGSLLMIISAVVLCIFIRENKIAEEMKDEMARGDALSATEEKVDDNKPMSKKNKIMLFLILGAEFFWFMADNGIGTFMSSYVIYGTHSSSVSTSLLTLAFGVGSIIGFAIGGIIASKIGRKFTVIGGLSLTLSAYLLWLILTFSVGLPLGKVPLWLFAVWFIKGFGMSLVHVNSFPMVVELCNSKKIGAFTGYYYASSMAAQTITPIALGTLLLVPQFDWNLLPVYASVCVAISLGIFFFVKNVSSTKTKFTKGLDAIGEAED